MDKPINDREIKIQNELQKHYDTLKEKGYEIVGVFLYGSQNYGLDYEDSDVDTKAIVLPKFKDFVLNMPPVSQSITIRDNDICDIKDIRNMFDCFKKQNINFIELLFTKYKILNREYEELYNPILANAEAIAHYNNYASVNCMAGMALEKLKALDHPYPSILDKIEKYGFDPKQLHHIIRLEEFITRYVNGEQYSDCLLSLKKEYLIKVKSECDYTLDEAKQLAKETTDFIVNFKNEYMKNNEVRVDKSVEKIMNDVLVDIIKYHFKKEIMA